MPEMADEALHRPGRGLPECTDGVALDLASRGPEHFEVGKARLHVGDAADHAIHPTGALAARGALATAFLEVEACDALAGTHHAGGVVHHDDRAGAEAGT